MSTEGVRKGPLLWLALVVLGFFAGLCSMFALVVTAAQAWQEHAQAQWPQAAATVQTCAVEIYMHKQKSYWIECRISYPVGAEQVVTRVHSRSSPAPSRVVSQHPTAQIDLMQDWVD